MVLMTYFDIYGIFGISILRREQGERGLGLGAGFTV